MEVLLINRNTGELRAQEVGWSWIILLFDIFFAIPLFVRRLYFWAALRLGLYLIIMIESGNRDDVGAFFGIFGGPFLLFLLYDIFFSFWGNRMAGRKLLRSGWEFADPGSLRTRYAVQKWQVDPPPPAAPSVPRSGPNPPSETSSDPSAGSDRS